MKALWPAALCLTLVVSATGTAVAQRGPGLARGFTDVGLGNWVLHEGGIDSIAAWYQFQDEHRDRLEQLTIQFQSENADVLERWRRMQREIQELWTGNQSPTRPAIHNVGEEYDHPGLELQPALEQLQLRATALLWIAHGTNAIQPSLTGAARGRAARPTGQGYGRRRDN